MQILDMPFDPDTFTHFFNKTLKKNSITTLQN